MSVSSSISIVLYTSGLTFYLVWGYTLIPKFYQAIFNKTFGFKNVFLLIGYLLPFVLIDYFLSNYPEQYTFISIYLSMGIISWLTLFSNIKYKNNLGELLFTSCCIQRKLYFTIPLTLIYLWVIYKYVLVFFQGSESAFAPEIFGTQINPYLYSICQLFLLLSIMINFYVTSWNKLEIRSKGICYFSAIVWQDIVGYDWSEEKNNLLIIKHLNGDKKEI
ncbi:hypothetical protein [Crocosphaera chwakensis]|uniref:Uncharacterized protein n=1 Tax=Crocosphaera chwakensis CCY0110 TaxID=391612 RepID=A3IPP6_9CHRO|nr:hypothetical protein [Crocosphaera chwakensis]EAZ91536.1 hypothetical protein CY0110_13486 [Crocosphaera chwakensis CCY0110]